MHNLLLKQQELQQNSNNNELRKALQVHNLLLKQRQQNSNNNSPPRFRIPTLGSLLCDPLHHRELRRGRDILGQYSLLHLLLEATTSGVSALLMPEQTFRLFSGLDKNQTFRKKKLARNC